MDNELFKLCKEVYEKTGWAADNAIFKLGDRIWTSEHEYSPQVEENKLDKSPFFKASKDNNKKEPYEVAPLYTSDYLLDKLPLQLFEQPDYVQNFLLDKIADNEWRAGYYGITQAEADTPRKALLKLTLALKDAGEL